jgi:crotonobetainyl-CoA:carnitine CoA-transferase CaiB-like acyl-CoA transferase
MTAKSFIAVNPMVGNYRTADGRYINLCVLQPGRFFKEVCEHLGLEHLLADERFATAEGIMAHAGEIGDQFTARFASETYAYWVKQLDTLEATWAPVQNTLEILADPQMEANGYLVPVTDAEGNQRQLVANPVQFDETPPSITRGPQFAEHTDDILLELGMSMDDIIQLKIEGACT